MGVSGSAPGTVRGVGVHSGVRLLRALVAATRVCSVLSRIAVTAPLLPDSLLEDTGEGNLTGLLFLWTHKFWDFDQCTYLLLNVPSRLW